MTKFTTRFMATLWATICLTAPAFSQTDNSANTDAQSQVFTPDYFTQFSPQTAADMVARLPGFDIRGGGGGRGFGQASLNILINNRRPSSKSSGANQILGRIPASNVIRIEIVDAASLNIPGLSGQVANITVNAGELSGSWEYAVRFEEGTQPQLGDGKINVSGKKGNLEVVAGLDFGQFSFSEDGEETFFDGSGNVTQDRTERLGFNTQRPRANLNLTLLRDNGDIANLNVSGERRNTNTDIFESFDDQTNPAFSGDSITANGVDRDRYEISGDYSLSAPALGRNGQLKFIALHGGVNFDFRSFFLFNDADTGQSDFLFERSDKEREYVGRAEYSWQTGETNDWTASLEGALNTLDSVTEFSEDGGDIDIEEVEVEELRLQGNLSRNWALNSKTNLQASLGAEYSVLTIPTSNNEDRKFFRPKGLISVSHALNDSWTLRAQAERSVGQLDFDIFVSTVNLSEDTENGGNSSIVPEQSWEAELELEHKNPTGLSGRATAFYTLTEDQIDQLLLRDETGIPLRDSDDILIQGPVNLNTNAQEYGIRANLTWVLDDVLKGLRLTAEGQVSDSTLEDPDNLTTRSISRQVIWDYDLEARWDIDGTPYAIESRLEQTGLGDRFRVDEQQTDKFTRPEFQVSLIHKDLFGMQWTARVQNILDFELNRDRLIFGETRNDPLSERQLTRRQRGRRFSIEVTDTF